MKQSSASACPLLITRLVMWAAAILLGSPLVAQEKLEAPLTTAAQIRALTPEQAAQQLPIKLRGSFMASEVNSFSMQDETDGLFVFTEPDVSLDFEMGDLIEVIGVTNPGDYAPCATATSVVRIGKADIPEPIQTTLAELFTGHMDAKWVEITGIVRTAENAPSTIPKPDGYLAPGEPNLGTKLKVAEGNSQVVVELQEVLDPSSIIDAKVRIRGHCFYSHNGARQFVLPILHSPLGIKPEIIRPTEHVDFAGDPKPISSLFTFDPSGGNPGHRVHVRGIVIHHQPQRALWIRDETQSIRIQSTQAEALKPGDVVDVLGFPEEGTYTPYLQDAVFRVAETQDPPKPQTIDEIRMITWHDSDLVQIEANLIEIQRYPETVELTLDALGTTVRASLHTRGEIPSLPGWQPKSRVRVTGIATVGEGEAIPLNGLWWSESLHILLRSADDLAIITPAPWWTAKRISYALSGFLALAIAIIALVVVLSRRRLREQLQHRAMAESEFSAILNERNRVAREIHDTLAQNIGAISVQLEIVRTDAKNLSENTQRHIQTAHTLARTALADARDSIWNMRSQVLEKYDLPGALERIAKQLTDNTGIEVDVAVRGESRRLPPVVENNLLRVGQEAMTNACKHAAPNKISLQINYRKRRVEMVVTDDGSGFDLEFVSSKENKRFGLVGIRERVELMGGQVDIQSRPGAGTEIRVEVSD